MKYILLADNPASPAGEGVPTRVRLIGPFGEAMVAIAWIAGNNHYDNPCWQLVDLDVPWVGVTDPESAARTATREQAARTNADAAATRAASSQSEKWTEMVRASRAAMSAHQERREGPPRSPGPERWETPSVEELCYRMMEEFRYQFRSTDAVRVVSRGILILAGTQIDVWRLARAALGVPDEPAGRFSIEEVLMRLRPRSVWRRAAGDGLVTVTDVRMGAGGVPEVLFTVVDGHTESIPLLLWVGRTNGRRNFEPQT